MVDSTDPEVPDPAPGLPGRSVEREGIVVLHVDDDPAVLELTAEELERQRSHFEVLTAESAAAGMETVESGDLDCVVSDYQMPEVDGLDFLEWVRDHDPDLPFVLYTGRGSETIASRAISAGVTDYLQKRGGLEQYELLANRIERAVSSARTRAALEASVRRYGALVEAAPVPIVLYDSEGTLVWGNAAAAAFAGVDVPADLRGRSASSFVHEADRERIADRMQRVLRDGESVPPAESRYVADDGTVRHAISVGAPVDADGERYGQSVLNDVTDRKARERDLERYRAIIESLREGVFLATGDGTITFLNRRIAAAGGFDPEDVVGRDVEALVEQGLIQGTAAAEISEAVASTAESGREQWLEVDPSVEGIGPLQLRFASVEVPEGRRVLVTTRMQPPEA